MRLPCLANDRKKYLTRLTLVRSHSVPDPASLDSVEDLSVRLFTLIFEINQAVDARNSTCMRRLIPITMLPLDMFKKIFHEDTEKATSMSSRFHSFSVKSRLFSGKEKLAEIKQSPQTRAL